MKAEKGETLEKFYSILKKIGEKLRFRKSRTGDNQRHIHHEYVGRRYST